MQYSFRIENSDVLAYSMLRTSITSKIIGFHPSIIHASSFLQVLFSRKYATKEYNNFVFFFFFGATSFEQKVIHQQEKKRKQERDQRTCGVELIFYIYIYIYVYMRYVRKEI